MNKTDLEIVMQTFILAMQGEETNYSLIYLNPPNPLLSNLGVQAANYTKFLIKLYENENLKCGESSKNE